MIKYIVVSTNLVDRQFCVWPNLRQDIAQRFKQLERVLLLLLLFPSRPKDRAPRLTNVSVYFIGQLHSTCSCPGTFKLGGGWGSRKRATCRMRAYFRGAGITSCQIESCHVTSILEVTIPLHYEITVTPCCHDPLWAALLV